MNIPFPLILASQSPRRKQLLELAEIKFDVIPSDVNEDFPIDMPVTEVPEDIAWRKARAIQTQYPDRMILAADTVVVLDEQIIGKPANRDEAIQILTSLAGQMHTVITGVVLLAPTFQKSFSESTLVFFNSLTMDEIIHYVDHYTPFDKAGAYAIQEWIGAVAIQKIEGCFYNVMGLPISRVVHELKKAGL